MVSSKFSRHPVIQQPPPVCRSKPKPIPPIPPPPHTRLWLHATWAGICTDWVYREFDEIIEFDESIPHEDRNYNASREANDIGYDFKTSILWPGFEPSKLTFEWNTETWRAIGYADINLPEEPPVDIGPYPVNSTFPIGQAGTFHIYTSA